MLLHPHSVYDVMQLSYLKGLLSHKEAMHVHIFDVKWLHLSHSIEYYTYVVTSYY